MVIGFCLAIDEVIRFRFRYPQYPVIALVLQPEIMIGVARQRRYLEISGQEIP